MIEFFVRDISEGIADTGVHAGIVKCAADKTGSPGRRAGAPRRRPRARETGVPITIHTDGRP